MTSAIQKFSLGVAVASAALAAQPATAQQAEPFKLGIVTFLSGAAAGPFGVPARNARTGLHHAQQCLKRASGGVLE